jgi:hypothetical protein
MSRLETKERVFVTFCVKLDCHTVYSSFFVDKKLWEFASSWNGKLHLNFLGIFRIDMKESNMHNLKEADFALAAKLDTETEDCDIRAEIVYIIQKVMGVQKSLE